MHVGVSADYSPGTYDHAGSLALFLGQSAQSYEAQTFSDRFVLSLTLMQLSTFAGVSN